jgi:hypothetical protein
VQAEEFFADQPLGALVLQRLQLGLESFGNVQVRTSKSQVAFRRERGFAYLWLPGQYL